MAIRALPPNLVNRIAAGEVVERPASVVKELIENAIDAGASRIDVTATGGGLSLIRVADDGSGMDQDDLALSVERHATSKLAGDDLANILTLGFRGEALPSIGSVARLAIQSRARGAANAYEVSVDAGRKAKLKPVALAQGTTVEVRDLFYATPARLKFMKSERAEWTSIAEMVKRLGLAKPEIGFGLANAERSVLRLPAGAPGLADLALDRIGLILGQDFVADALPVSANEGRTSRRRLCRPADIASPQRHAVAPHRQRPAGARQIAERCGARCLRRSRAERPLSHGRALSDAPAR